MNINSNNHKIMESNKKEMYNSPEVDIFEVKTEGVICASGLRDSYGDSNNGVDPGLLDGNGIWNW